MSKVWFCRTCGYEVTSRGRCHACKGRLERSPLPELAPADEDDEVGYRLDGWDGPGRGRLIVALIEAGIEHRFDEDDLVVAVDDESRTDDLIDAVSAGADLDDVDAGTSRAHPVDPPPPEIDLLVRAAARLRQDPTDMQADGDVAQASAAIFAVERVRGLDEETWAAVGRVTRRLLAALGADEALEDEIRLQAAILVKLLAPLGGAGRPDPPPSLGAAVPAEGDGTETEAAGRGAPDAPQRAEGSESEPASVRGAEERGEREASVYELPDWLPEQRAELGVLLDDAGVAHEWAGVDLVVSEADEAAVEALFDRVGGVRDDDEDDESRYQALAELFHATSRFVNDPDSETKAAEVVVAVDAADGPTPVGLDDATWWTIRTRARELAHAIESGAALDIVFGEASTLRDLLRDLV
jgi:hypothetical protein